MTTAGTVVQSSAEQLPEIRAIAFEVLLDFDDGVEREQHGVKHTFVASAQRLPITQHFLDPGADRFSKSALTQCE